MPVFFLLWIHKALSKSGTYPREAFPRDPELGRVRNFRLVTWLPQDDRVRPESPRLIAGRRAAARAGAQGFSARPFRSPRSGGNVHLDKAKPTENLLELVSFGH